MKSKILYLLTAVFLSSCSVPITQDSLKSLPIKPESKAFSIKNNYSINFNEQAFLLAYKSEIQNSSFKSGLGYYLSLSESARQEYLSNTVYLEKKKIVERAIEDGYNENAYILFNPAIKPLIQSGQYINALEYYLANPSSIINANYSNNISKINDAYAEGFNEEAYIFTFNDIGSNVKKGNLISPLWHYVFYGKNEGRLISGNYGNVNNKVQAALYSSFDNDAYLIAFEDAIFNNINDPNNSLYSAFHHYSLYGAGEGRLNFANYISTRQNINNAIAEGFDQEVYMTAFPEVYYLVNNAKVFKTAVEHYLSYGKAMGLLNSSQYISTRDEINNAKAAGFNPETYRFTYQNIKSLIKPELYVSGLEQFILKGIISNNLTKAEYSSKKAQIDNARLAGFTEQRYLAAYSDVYNSIKAGVLKSGLAHYLSSGYSLSSEAYLTAINKLSNNTPETTDDFNSDAYIIAFADIANALKAGTLESAFFHFVHYGFNEFRLSTSNYINTKATVDSYLSAGFNEKAYLLAFPDVAAKVKAKEYLSAMHYHYMAGNAENRLNKKEYLRAKKYFIPDTNNSNLSNFDEESYLLAFPDIAAKVKSSDIYENSNYISELHYYLKTGKYTETIDSANYTDTKNAIQEINDKGFNKNAYWLTYYGQVNSSQYKDPLEHYLRVGIPGAYIYNNSYFDKKAMQEADINNGYLEEAYNIYLYQNALSEYNTMKASYLTAYEYFSTKDQTTKNNILNSSAYNLLRFKILTAFNNGFNEDIYLRSFGDIKTGVDNNQLHSGLYHYINWGITEGRLSWTNYINNYRQVFSSNIDGGVGAD